jgi:uncharacterized membrane protein YbaN (DUF454 family)
VVRQIRRGVTIVFGVFFLLLGVISGFLPVIQGWIFVLIGLTLLAKEIPWVHHHVERLKSRFPKQAAQLNRLKRRLTSDRPATPHTDERPGAAPK